MHSVGIGNWKWDEIPTLAAAFEPICFHYELPCKPASNLFPGGNASWNERLLQLNSKQFFWREKNLKGSSKILIPLGPFCSRANFIFISHPWFAKSTAAMIVFYRSKFRMLQATVNLNLNFFRMIKYFFQWQMVCPRRKSVLPP